LDGGDLGESRIIGISDWQLDNIDAIASVT
jgi:hypothetical protein